jgi:hypothetical protein
VRLGKENEKSKTRLERQDKEDNRLETSKTRCVSGMIQERQDKKRESRPMRQDRSKMR